MPLAPHPDPLPGVPGRGKCARVGLARPLNDFNFGWHALSTRRAWAVLSDLGLRVAARPINETVRRHLCLVFKRARCASSLIAA